MFTGSLIVDLDRRQLVRVLPSDDSIRAYLEIDEILNELFGRVQTEQFHTAVMNNVNGEENKDAFTAGKKFLPNTTTKKGSACRPE